MYVYNYKLEKKMFRDNTKERKIKKQKENKAHKQSPDQKEEILIVDQD